nr:hypothetical protein [Nonomuraea candida]
MNTGPDSTPDLVTLSAALLLFGAVHGVLDVAMNAGAVQVERAYGRPIMSSFHAVYSLGGFAGAAAGELFAHRELTAAATFWTVGALIVVLAAWAARWTLHPTPAPAPTPALAYAGGTSATPCARAAGTTARPLPYRSTSLPTAAMPMTAPAATASSARLSRPSPSPRRSLMAGMRAVQVPIAAPDRKNSRRTATRARLTQPP